VEAVGATPTTVAALLPSLSPREWHVCVGQRQSPGVSKRQAQGDKKWCVPGFVRECAVPARPARQDPIGCGMFGEAALAAATEFRALVDCEAARVCLPKRWKEGCLGTERDVLAFVFGLFFQDLSCLRTERRIRSLESWFPRTFSLLGSPGHGDGKPRTDFGTEVVF